MNIGEKIKSYRLKYNLSQKELSKFAGMSEPTIRNYELGNRTPSDIQLKKIADALKISIYELKLPDFETYEGLMHALFYLENYCGLEVSLDKNNEKNIAKLNFNINTTVGENMNNSILTWIKAKNNCKGLPLEEYDIWKAKYPPNNLDKRTPITPVYKSLK